MIGDRAARRALLEEVRRLVTADGAELEPLSDYEDSPVIELRLVFPADCCQECVLSKAVLEDVAAHIFRDADPTVAGVRVHDPREPTAS